MEERRGGGRGRRKHRRGAAAGLRRQACSTHLCRFCTFTRPPACDASALIHQVGSIAKAEYNAVFEQLYLGVMAQLVRVIPPDVNVKVSRPADDSVMQASMGPPAHEDAGAHFSLRHRRRTMRARRMSSSLSATSRSS
jgi:hypothetical protein